MLGETVRFELQAPPTAQKVQLRGDFTTKPIDAVLESGTWRVSVPLADGFYNWWWLVDGSRPKSLPSGAPVAGTREVRPLQPLSRAYPEAN